jgi:hypothetical protein
MKARQFVLYVVAVLIAPIVGEFVALPVAIFMDFIAGVEVTGGRWSLNIANVLLTCIKGSIIGCVAGTIAKKRPKLISALATFAPLELFIAMELISNRDMSEYMAAIYDTKPALWAWIALIPAMISGHFAAKVAQQSRWVLVQTLGMIILLGGLNICLAVVHLCTTYMAYKISGVLAAFITFVTPPISELFWFSTIWKSTGMFLNLYTLQLLACGLFILVAGVVGGIFVGLGTKFDPETMAEDAIGQPSLRRV